MHRPDQGERQNKRGYLPNTNEMSGKATIKIMIMLRFEFFSSVTAIFAVAVS